MALLRNREVTVLGPNGTSTSPIYTVMYPDGTREDVELRYIHFTEDEKKDFAKSNPTLADNLKVVDNKKLQQVRDDQDREKIQKNRDKHPDDKPVAAKTYVKPSEVKAQ